jgi:hypothetical protein
MVPANSSTALQNNIDRFKPTVAFVVMIFGALIAFEIFNFSTTDHALSDLLGDLSFLGILPWSTVLAIAFCGIDFAGIARLFTPEQTISEEPKEVWYLFGAWLLAATMNAILTWWGISMAVATHTMTSTTVIDPQTLTTIVPIFVAIMVWVIRILIIGTLSLTMDRLLHPGSAQNTPLSSIMHGNPSNKHATQKPLTPRPSMMPTTLNTSGFATRPAAKSASASPRGMRTPAVIPINEDEDVFDPGPRSTRPEPTYHSLSGRPPVNNPNNNNNNNNNSRYRR